MLQLEFLKNPIGVFTVMRPERSGHFLVPEELRTQLHLSEDKTEWTPKELGRLIFSEDQDETFMKFAHAVRSGESFDAEFRIVGDDNVSRWVRSFSSTYKDSRTGRLTSCWHVLEVTHYREELALLNRHLELRDRQLDQANRALADFAYALSHDLRRPARHIHSYTDLLKESLNSGKCDDNFKFVDRIRQASTNLVNMIDRMLGFSQIGHRSLKHEEIDQEGFIAELMSRACLERNISNIQWAFKTSLPPAFADKPLWEILWCDLIDNAIKFSCDRNVISVEFSAEINADQCGYCISDNGIGFNSDEAKRLFEIFQKFTSEERFEGSGIGLAQARRIAEAHGGSIYARSQPGAGATFCVLLPVSSAK